MVFPPFRLASTSPLFLGRSICEQAKAFFPKFFSSPSLYGPVVFCWCLLPNLFSFSDQHPIPRQFHQHSPTPPPLSIPRIQANICFYSQKAPYNTVYGLRNHLPFPPIQSKREFLQIRQYRPPLFDNQAAMSTEPRIFSLPLLRCHPFSYSPLEMSFLGPRQLSPATRRDHDIL